MESFLLFLFLIFLVFGHTVCRIPDQGSNPHPLQWKLGFLTTGPSQKVPWSLS